MPGIPVNLITGFLGVGKTTAVRWLLERHPPAQRWAVLVNEFGEVGVDGTLLADTGAVVQEVAGGCLCCVAAPAFTTGLNRLIRQHRPDRILIEPSGLGHPAQVLETLRGPLYQGVLRVEATLCLIDPRHLSSPRHLEHPVFQDQVHLADVLVANKIDCATTADLAAFERFVLAANPVPARVGTVSHGRVDPDWLSLSVGSVRQAAFPEAHAFLVESTHDSSGKAAASPADWLLIEGRADGYFRAGWSIRQATAWPRARFAELWRGLDSERMKAIVHTSDGWLAFNQQQHAVVPPPADQRARIELIDPRPIDASAIDAVLRTLVA